MAIAAGNEMRRIHNGAYETYRIVFCPVHRNYLENKYRAEDKETTQCLSAQKRCDLFNELFESVQTPDGMELVADPWEETKPAQDLNIVRLSNYWTERAKNGNWNPKETISSTDLMLHYPMNCFLAGYDNFGNIENWDFRDKSPFKTRSLCVVGRETSQLNIAEFSSWVNNTFQRAVIGQIPYEYSQGSWTHSTNVTEPLLVGLPPLEGTLAGLSATKLKRALRTLHQQESSVEEKTAALQIVKGHGYQNVESLAAFV